MQDKKFFNFYSTEFSLQELIVEIKNFLREDTASSYKLTIGTDSETKKDGKNKTVLELITAIVVYRKGYGGKYFWTRTRRQNVKTLREKIYQEVLLSIEAAQVFVPELKTQLADENGMPDLEIHIDVGEHGETREMIKEVVGIVTGYGYVARTKPYSYAASNIADKYA